MVMPPSQRCSASWFSSRNPPNPPSSTPALTNTRVNPATNSSAPSTRRPRLRGASSNTSAAERPVTYDR